MFPVVENWRRASKSSGVRLAALEFYKRYNTMFSPLFRASGTMHFLSANYALLFGELCAKNPKLCMN